MAKKHIHKYMRQALRHITVWRCALPQCSHFMPPHFNDLIIGRASICWSCGNTFTLDESAMADDMPTCINCRQSSNEEVNVYVRQTS